MTHPFWCIKSATQWNQCFTEWQLLAESVRRLRRAIRVIPPHGGNWEDLTPLQQLEALCRFRLKSWVPKQQLRSSVVVQKFVATEAPSDGAKN